MVDGSSHPDEYLRVIVESCLTMPGYVEIGWCVFLFSYALTLLPFFRTIHHYGKLQNGPSSIWHVVPNALGWASMYFCGIVVTTTAALLSSWMSLPSSTTPTFTLSVLFSLHCSRRLLECAFVHNFSPRPMALVNWIAGIGFYVLTSVTVVMSDTVRTSSYPPTRLT